MKIALLLVLLLILNYAEINASSVEKEYTIQNSNLKITAKLTYSCSVSTTNTNQNTLNLSPENLNFNFTKMIGTFKSADVEGTISSTFSTTVIKFKLISILKKVQNATKIGKISKME